MDCCTATSSPPFLYHPFIHNTCQMEWDLKFTKTPLHNGCNHLLDFMDTTPPKAAMVLEWHRVDNEVGMATDLATTTMEDMVEFQAFECNTITHLIHSINSTTGNIALAHGICTKQFVVHLSPGQMHTPSLVLVFVGPITNFTRTTRTSYPAHLQVGVSGHKTWTILPMSTFTQK